ncbi:MAG: hypothetical protein GF393_08880 [Armatimonadia bacterium]|nr:hypothetical protein [Armatimonadia bacterium]
MRRLPIILTIALLSVSQVMAQDQEILYFADFEEGSHDFTSGDPVAELSITHDPDLVFAGDGSLQLSYVQAPMYTDMPDWGVPGALVLPFPDSAAGLGEVAFALRSRIATPVVVMLVEGEDGPRYNCLVWCSADEWNEYSLTPDDFTYDRESPTDPNGRLDLEQTAGIALIDADCIVRGIAEASPLFHIEPAAEQSLWLDEFTLRSGSPAPSTDDDPLALAQYSPPMRGFLALGGRDLRISSEPLAENGFALRADYTTPATTLFGLMHTIRPGALVDAEAVRFQAKTNRAVTLIVVIEERRGPDDNLDVSRYQTLVELEPSEEFEMLTLPLSLFTLGDDQTDPDGALDAELVDTFSIADATALLENAEVINTLRLQAPVVVE